MLTRKNIVQEAVREAISHLGLLSTDAEPTVVSLMPETLFLHPRQICTTYRKSGKQLSKDDKRALGIRGNGFMSVEAAGHLSMKGKAAPLTSHELTLMRAIFTRLRFQNIHGAHRYGSDSLKLDCLNKGTCAGCRRLDGLSVRGYQAPLFPPDDCETETCNMGVGSHRNFIEEYALRHERDTFTLAYDATIVKLPGLFVSIRDATPRETPGSYYFNFDFTCMHCGSETAETDDTHIGKICRCPGCRVIFGMWSDVETLAQIVASMELERLAGSRL
jgi:hypothetical protein